jgi:hypothetical protein
MNLFSINPTAPSLRTGSRLITHDDPRRSAILLIGGRRPQDSDKRFYHRTISVADDLHHCRATIGHPTADNGVRNQLLDDAIGSGWTRLTLRQRCKGTPE